MRLSLFSLGPARGARPFPVGCAPPDPAFLSTSHASRNAPPPILHAPPHAHPPLCPCVPLELPARPLVMLPPAYPQAFPCHALGPPPPCASPDNAKRQALAAPARHGKPQTEHMHCQSKPAMETPAHGVCVCLIRNCANAKQGARIAALPCGMACMVMVRICHRQIRPSRLGGSSPAP